MFSSIRVHEASFTSSPYRRFRSSVLPITVRTPEEPSDVPSAAPQPAARRPHPTPRPAARSTSASTPSASRSTNSSSPTPAPSSPTPAPPPATTPTPPPSSATAPPPLTLPAAAALLCSLHDPDELADMGLRLVRHITRTTAATRHRDPVVLELSDAPEEAGR
ncbi:hypothetical protein ACIOKA_18950 [Streptomyces anulatus]